MRVMIRTDLIEELLHVRLRVSFAKVGDFTAEVGRATAQVTELLLQVLRSGERKRARGREGEQTSRRRCRLCSVTCAAQRSLAREKKWAGHETDREASPPANLLGVLGGVFGTLRG